MNSHFTVVYDACVLYSAPLCDLLIRLAMADIFRARWSDQIHEEWITALLRNRPDIKREQLLRRKQLMNSHVRDCLVHGYEYLIPSLNDLPDENDRHVVAAAIHCHASAVVTKNGKDFPDAVLSRHGIEALHPDDFILYQFDMYPSAVIQAASRQRRALKNPPIAVDDFLDILLKQGLTQTVDKLRDLKFAL